MSYFSSRKKAFEGAPSKRSPGRTINGARIKVTPLELARVVCGGYITKTKLREMVALERKRYDDPSIGVMQTIRNWNRRN
jgi:hypothetical protein